MTDVTANADGVKRRRPSDKELEGFAHGAQISADIDGVGDEEQNCDRIEQPCRSCFAQISSQTVARRPADPGADFLNGCHERKSEQHRPASGEAELRTCLTVGADA